MTSASARALVIDDGHNDKVAEDFTTEFTRLGGETERRSLHYTEGAEPRDMLRAWTVGSEVPEVVFWAGDTDSGGAALRVAMTALGYDSTPLVSWDGLWDGSGSIKDSFIELAGASAVNTFVSHASLPLAKAEFAERYRQAFGNLPDEYSAAGHACAEVIFTALRSIATTGVSADGLREAVRARVTDPGPSVRDRPRVGRLRRQRRRARPVRHVLSGRDIGGRRQGRLGHHEAAGLRPRHLTPLLCRCSGSAMSVDGGRYLRATDHPPRLRHPMTTRTGRTCRGGHP